MQTSTMTQYEMLGPGLNSLARDIELMLEVYTEITVVLTVLVLGVILCLLICEMKQSKESKPVPRRPALTARELSDTGF